MKRSITLTAIALVFSAHQAQAAGTYIPDVGTVGLSRAGAMAADSNDLTALFYNPANLVQSPGWHLQLDMSLVFRQVRFARAGDANTASYPEVDNHRAAPAPIPAIFAGYTFASVPIAIVLGLHAPNNAPLEMEETGPQRYSMVRTRSLIFWSHLGVAYRPWRFLSIGAGLMLGTVMADQAFAVTTGVFGPESRQGDVFVGIKATQAILPSFNVGIAVEPGAGFRLGASFTPARQATPTGQLQITPSPELAPLIAITGDRFAMSQTLPAIFRAGVAYRWEDRLLVEADYVLEGWSSYGTITITPRDISYQLLRGPVTPIPEIRLTRNWKDSHSLRAGGEILLWRAWDLRLRVGYFFEPGTVPNATLNVSSTDIAKHGVTGGIGLRVGAITINAAYGHTFFPTRVVTDSQHTSVNPLDASATTVVGNGTYRLAFDVCSLGVSAAF